MQHIWKLKDMNVSHVGSGDSHVVVLASSLVQSFALARRFYSTLLVSNEKNNADLQIVHASSSLSAGSIPQVFALHQCMLAARCPLLLSDLLDMETKNVTDDFDVSVVSVNISSNEIRSDTFSVLVEYLYRDEVDWRDTKRGRRTLPEDVLQLAQKYNLPRLASMCATRTSTKWRNGRSDGVSGGVGGMFSGNRGALLREIKRKVGTSNLVLRHTETRLKSRLTGGSEGTELDTVATSSLLPSLLAPSTVHVTTKAKALIKTNEESGETKAPHATATMPSTYQTEMLQLLRNAETCKYVDVHLSSHGMKSCEEKPIPCHRAILCRYPFFRALLNGAWKESHAEIVMLGEELSRAALSTVLEFVYTGNEAVINDDNVMELLHCSAIFDLDDLKNLTERYISIRLDEENANDVLFFSKMMGLERLAREAEDVLEFSKRDQKVSSGV